MSTEQTQASEKLMQQIAEFEIEREQTLSNGIPALERLANIAQGDTGQCDTVRRFLLCLYNGHRFPFDLNRLRGLDKNIFDDCMAVMRLDARATVKEVHRYFKNGSQLFEGWAKSLAA